MNEADKSMVMGKLNEEFPKFNHLFHRAQFLPVPDRLVWLMVGGTLELHISIQYKDEKWMARWTMHLTDGLGQAVFATKGWRGPLEEFDGMKVVETAKTLHWFDQSNT